MNEATTEKIAVALVEFVLLQLFNATFYLLRLS